MKRMESKILRLKSENEQLINISSQLRVKVNRVEEGQEEIQALKENEKELNEYIYVLEKELNKFQD